VVPVGELLLELEGFELDGFELDGLELEGFELDGFELLTDPADSPDAEPVDDPEPIVTFVRMNWAFFDAFWLERDDSLDELLLPIVSLLVLPLVPVALCAADCRQPVSVISRLLRSLDCEPLVCPLGYELVCADAPTANAAQTTIPNTRCLFIRCSPPK
jgi:hypothetical protein